MTFSESPFTDEEEARIRQIIREEFEREGREVEQHIKYALNP